MSNKKIKTHSNENKSEQKLSKKLQSVPIKNQFLKLQQNLQDFSEKYSEKSQNSCTSSQSNSFNISLSEKKQGMTINVLINCLKKYVQNYQKNIKKRGEPIIKKQKWLKISKKEEWESYKISLGNLIEPSKNYNKSLGSLVQLLDSLNRMTNYQILPKETINKKVLSSIPGENSEFWTKCSSVVHLNFEGQLINLTLHHALPSPPSSQVRSYLSQMYIRSTQQFQQTVRNNLDNIYKKVLSQYQQDPPQSTQLQQIKRLKQQFSLSKNLLQQQSNLSSSTNEESPCLSFRYTTRFVKNINRRVSMN